VRLRAVQQQEVILPEIEVREQAGLPAQLRDDQRNSRHDDRIRADPPGRADGGTLNWRRR
jgi:hypothetical protein